MNQYRFFPEQKTKRSFVLRYLCPVKEVLTSYSNQISATKGWGRELLEDAGFSKVI